MPGDIKVDIGKLSKPATVLIEKISDAVGGGYLSHIKLFVLQKLRQKLNKFVQTPKLLSKTFIVELCTVFWKKKRKNRKIWRI
jgi:hypothetical protein